MAQELQAKRVALVEEQNRLAAEIGDLEGQQTEIDESLLLARGAAERQPRPETQKGVKTAEKLANDLSIQLSRKQSALELTRRDLVVIDLEIAAAGRAELLSKLSAGLQEAESLAGSLDKSPFDPAAWAGLQDLHVKTNQIVTQINQLDGGKNGHYARFFESPLKVRPRLWDIAGKVADSAMGVVRGGPKHVPAVGEALNLKRAKARLATLDNG